MPSCLSVCIDVRIGRNRDQLDRGKPFCSSLIGPEPRYNDRSFALGQRCQTEYATARIHFYSRAWMSKVLGPVPEPPVSASLSGYRLLREFITLYMPEQDGLSNRFSEV
jgi:hypothetical protein